MAAKKLADLLKEARTNAKLSQTALAEKVDGMSAAQIGKAEKGELVPTQAQLKQIAKATGVTQTSLIEASKTASAKKTSSSSTAKKTSSSTKKEEEFKLTATEKNLVELYRKADSDTKKAAVKLLKGEKTELSEMLTQLLGGKNGLSSALQTLIKK